MIRGKFHLALDCGFSVAFFAFLNRVAFFPCILAIFIDMMALSAGNLVLLRMLLVARTSPAPWSELAKARVSGLSHQAPSAGPMRATPAEKMNTAAMAKHETNFPFFIPGSPPFVFPLPAGVHPEAPDETPAVFDTDSSTSKKGFAAPAKSDAARACPGLDPGAGKNPFRTETSYIPPTACEYAGRKNANQASGILVKFFPFRK